MLILTNLTVDFAISRRFLVAVFINKRRLKRGAYVCMLSVSPAAKILELKFSSGLKPADFRVLEAMEGNR